MKIEFDKLMIEHFRSFNETQTLDLRKLAIGVHFVTGRNLVRKSLGANGNGKSSMVNALSWCLYGQTTDGLKSSDIKPWTGRGKPKVTVTARFDGKRRTITRIAPAAISLDGKEVGQDEIDRLMHMGFNVFKQTVLFGQEEPLFFDLPNKGKLELLSDVLELDKWDLRSHAASERTRELEQKQESIAAERDAVDRSIEHSSQLLKEAVASGLAWAEGTAAKLETLAADRKKLRAELAKANAELVKAERLGIEKAKQLGEAQADKQIAQNHLNKYENDVSKAAGATAGLKRQHQAVRDQLEKLKESRRCPTCGQTVAIGGLSKHKGELREQLKELQACIDDVDWPDEKLKVKWKHEHIVAHGREVNYQTEVDHWRREAQKQSAAKAHCNAELASLEKFTKERESERNPYAEQTKQLKGQINVLKAQRVNLELEHDKAGRRAARAKFWIKGFKDVRLLVVDEVLQELELVTNSILEEIGLVGWAVNYAVERQTQAGTVQAGMQVMIASPDNKKPVKWEAWSGGERHRLRLAGALALSEVLLSNAKIEIDLEILDEPTKHLSDIGVRDLGEMLAERAEQVGRRILYIDHAAYEGSQFTSTITVQRTREGSQIIGG